MSNIASFLRGSAAGWVLCAGSVAAVAAPGAVSQREEQPPVLPDDARGAADFIRDGGSFFSGDTLREAGKTIRKIREDTGKDVIVRTYATPPQGSDRAIQEKGKKVFYDEWIKQLARENHVNGILILAVRSPGRLQIVVGNNTRERLFTARDRDELTALMLNRFREKDFDKGLLEGTQFILQRMTGNGQPGDAHFSAAPTTRPGAGDGARPPAITAARTQESDEGAAPRERSSPNPTTRPSAPAATQPSAGRAAPEEKDSGDFE